MHEDSMKIAAWSTNIAGYDITLTQLSKRGNIYHVRYGQQIKSNLTYAEACKELGACIMHALSLEGKL